MEPWFAAALIGVLFAGVSNFTFKIAAKRNYNSSLFSLYGGVTAVIMILVALLFKSESVIEPEAIKWLTMLAGILAALSGILKVVALKFIDSTIYFPLFKLLAPGLAIIFGIVLFDESFTSHEWIGMIMGLLVPLMLITRAENGRQNNLVMGLLIVLATGMLSVGNAVMYKYVMDSGTPLLVALWFSALGILIGSLLSMIYTKGIYSMLRVIKAESSWSLVLWGSLRAALITIGFGFTLFAYGAGGSLAIVQTVHSFYILIPIVLAVIIYGEHWNLQKAIAIVLSVAALALMG